VRNPAVRSLISEAPWHRKDCKLAELGEGPRTGGRMLGLGIPPQRTSDALTPAVHLRPVAGARRAIPRTIHGVRLAINSTARSERRIVVRRSGVGVDAS
jgi:hypothetical protein